MRHELFMVTLIAGLIIAVLAASELLATYQTALVIAAAACLTYAGLFTVHHYRNQK